MAEKVSFKCGEACVVHCRVIVGDISYTTMENIMNTSESSAEVPYLMLKELRISRHLSQEQLADMSGLNVRTIQRIESGSRASLESKKCIASALDIDILILDQEKHMIAKSSDHWKSLPTWLRWWFITNFLTLRPTRGQAKRVELMCHISGFCFCLLGVLIPTTLPCGLVLLCSAYFTRMLLWQGDSYNVWLDASVLANK